MSIREAIEYGVGITLIFLLLGGWGAALANVLISLR